MVAVTINVIDGSSNSGGGGCCCFKGDGSSISGMWLTGPSRVHLCTLLFMVMMMMMELLGWRILETLATNCCLAVWHPPKRVALSSLNVSE